ncbi:SMI1/KNR4 family protein [Luteolibacter ambystomatis]|uniref:SMI1/KNR4 family protein n=1 Tax=Luteolibacter ambystomatis TaxID=2824561 RepID=A0A975IYF7_9BACT|nr:SMI1/KNR4 family protein [Luteolibacter ambystomatis]QUE50341.1 SMI1/KNR4 family protein [Luteolibacter ambystomatis]
MKFINVDKILTEEEVADAEKELGFAFPKALRLLFLQHNGGDPDPYVFKSDTLDTLVNETLPLVSSKGRVAALDTYRNLILRKMIAPKKFFPFAVDPGGDYFFVDCEKMEAPVYYYRSDSIFSSGQPLEQISESLEQFWKELQPEE